MTKGTEPLLPRTPTLPQAQRLSGQKFGLVAAALFGALVVYLFVTLSNRQKVQETPKPAPKPSPYEVSGTAQPDIALRLQQSYAGWNREPKPEPKPVELPPIPRAEPISTSPDVLTQQMLPPLPPLTTPLPAQLPPTPQSSTTSQPTPAASTTGTTAKEPPKPKRWLFAKVDAQSMGKSPFPTVEKPDKAEKPEGATQESDKASSGLVHAAQWVKPHDVTHVLYRSQTIHGVLLHEVDSDLPGQLRIMVTRAVQDKFGQGVTLVPQHTILLGEQQGKTAYGINRLDVAIVELEFPDGTLVNLAKAKLTDKSGAVGGAGHTNNHYGSLLLGTGISALLSIGARAPFGNTEGFQPSLSQDFGRDVAQGVNQSGQRVVGRELLRNPTITIKAGTEVAVQLQENLSFATAPRPVK